MKTGKFVISIDCASKALCPHYYYVFMFYLNVIWSKNTIVVNLNNAHNKWIYQLIFVVVLKLEKCILKSEHYDLFIANQNYYNGHTCKVTVIKTIKITMCDATY